MALFGREYELIADTLSIEGLDLTFKVVKTLTPDPNSAEIRIYNLNRTHREQLEQKEDVATELHVGYAESETARGMIFRGTLREAFSVQDPPDWITTLRTGDGDKAVRTSRINKGFSPGTAFTRLLDELADTIGVGIGNAKEAFDKGNFAEGAKELLHGGNLQGTAYKELKRLLRSANLEFSIQDEELQVLELGKALEGVATVINRNTGMVGSPRRGAKGELKLRCLLIPDLYPGRKIKLESRQIEGFFRVEKAVYVGSTFDTDWYVDLECKELSR